MLVNRGNAYVKRVDSCVNDLGPCLWRVLKLLQHEVLKLFYRTWPLLATWQQRNRPLSLVRFLWFL